MNIKKIMAKRLPRMAMLYREIKENLLLKRSPAITPWGFKLVGNESMANGTFEPIETELVRDILKEVDILVNIGANIGYYCCHALSMGKPVMAFEPIQKNVQYLCKNIKINGWPDAEIFPLALSNEVNVIEIYGGNTGASLIRGWAGTPDSYVNLAPSSTLDLVVGSRLKGKRALVLVDIEGAEKAMLDGASGILSNHPKPLWLIEITVREHQPEGVEVNPHLIQTFKCMFDAGYQAFSIGNKIRRVTMADVRFAQEGESSIFNTHNFLFKSIDSDFSIE